MSRHEEDTLRIAWQLFKSIHEDMREWRTCALIQGWLDGSNLNEACGSHTIYEFSEAR